MSSILCANARPKSNRKIWVGFRCTKYPATVSSMLNLDRQKGHGSFEIDLS